MRYLVLLSVFLMSTAAHTAEPIVIGHIGPQTAVASYQQPFDQAYELAIKEINTQGGILGRPVKLIMHDDQGQPEVALRIAKALLNQKPLHLLTFSGMAETELALSQFARQHQRLLLSGHYNSDHFIWRDGHRYAFRVGGPTPYAFNKMLAERAATAGKRKWMNVGPAILWGKNNVADFKQHLQTYQPEAQWLPDYWTPPGQTDISAVIDAIVQSGADGIYTTLYGQELVQFIHQGQQRGLFDQRQVVSLTADLALSLAMKQGVTPAGWLGLVYPVDEIDLPAHRAYVKRYVTAYGEKPTSFALFGYTLAYFIKTLLETAGTTDQETLIETLETDFEFPTVIGSMKMRALDHQSTFGTWIGETAVIDGQPKIVHWAYKEIGPYMPSAAYIKGLRQGH